MQLKDVGASLRRHWVTAVAILLAIPVVVGVYLFNNKSPIAPPPRYTTSADVIIPTQDPKSGQRPENVPLVLLQGQVELALSGTVKAFALQAAHLNPDRAAGVSFGARMNTAGDTITLSVSAPKPEVASTVLDQYVTAYSDGRRQSVLDAAINRSDNDKGTIDTLTRKLTDIQGQLAALAASLPAMVPEGSPLPVPPGTPNSTLLLLYQRNSIRNEIQSRQIDYGQQATLASIPGDYADLAQRRTATRVAPPPPSQAMTVLEIIGVGLLLAVAVPVLMDRFDRSITDTRSAASNLRSRVLGSVPAIPRRLHVGYAPRGSSWDAAFRSLAATSISTDNLPQAIMVSSPTGSIHDTVAANFARALARLGVRVALVGTVPRQHWYANTVPEAAIPEYDEDYDYDDESELDSEASEPVTMPASPPVAPAPADETAGTETDEPGNPAADTQEGEHDEFDHPTFADLLRDAETGQLAADFRDTLATVEDLPTLYIVPPGNAADLALNGLPPLLDAFSRDGIDTVVIGGPAYLEDPDATIIAWSTRNVLWALEIGHVDSRDAQLAADRLDIAGVAPFGIAVVNRHI